MLGTVLLAAACRHRVVDDTGSDNSEVPDDASGDSSGDASDTTPGGDETAGGDTDASSTDDSSPADTSGEDTSREDTSGEDTSDASGDEPVDPPPVDADGDGYPVPLDCDDTAPEVFPGAMERLWDEVDQDCDGGVDTTPWRTIDTRFADVPGPAWSADQEGVVLLSWPTLAEGYGQTCPGAEWATEWEPPIEEVRNLCPGYRWFFEEDGSISRVSGRIKYIDPGHWNWSPDPEIISSTSDNYSAMTIFFRNDLDGRFAGEPPPPDRRWAVSGVLLAARASGYLERWLANGPGHQHGVLWLRWNDVAGIGGDRFVSVQCEAAAVQVVHLEQCTTGYFRMIGCEPGGYQGYMGVVSDNWRFDYGATRCWLAQPSESPYRLILWDADTGAFREAFYHLAYPQNIPPAQGEHPRGELTDATPLMWEPLAIQTVRRAGAVIALATEAGELRVQEGADAPLVRVGVPQLAQVGGGLVQQGSAARDARGLYAAVVSALGDDAQVALVYGGDDWTGARVLTLPQPVGDATRLPEEVTLMARQDRLWVAARVRDPERGELQVRWLVYRTTP